MLDDISGVKTWEKVNTGMIKMYRAEVLGKLPVIQHFLFGSILPIPEGLPSLPTPSDENGNGHGHGHVHDVKIGGWGDCCGIPVPSAFGAKAAGEHPSLPITTGMEGSPQGIGFLSGSGIRPVPFD